MTRLASPFASPVMCGSRIHAFLFVDMQQEHRSPMLRSQKPFRIEGFPNPNDRQAPPPKAMAAARAAPQQAAEQSFARLGLDPGSREFAALRSAISAGAGMHR